MQPKTAAEKQRAKLYARAKTKLTIARFILSVALPAAVLLSGASNWLADLVAGWTGNFYLQIPAYLALFASACWLVSLPLDFYAGFTLEHRFGLSNQTRADWLRKTLLKFALSMLLLLVVAEGFYWLLRSFPRYWPVPATAGWVLFAVVLGKVAPALIIPLFYKCEPIGESELTHRLSELARRCSVPVRRIFHIHLASETRKANAAVAGFGKSRRILLSDTLLENYNPDEIEAVFAHELGHIRMHHTVKILGFSAASSIVCLYLARGLFEAGAGLFSFEAIYEPAAIPLLLLALTAAALILLPAQNWFLRRLEIQADAFALSHTEDNQSFISAMTKLSEQNLTDASPSKFEKVFFYDHPPISERMRYSRREPQTGPDDHSTAGGFSPAGEANLPD